MKILESAADVTPDVLAAVEQTAVGDDLTGAVTDVIKNAQAAAQLTKAGWEEGLHPRGFHGKWIAALSHLRDLHGQGTGQLDHAIEQLRNSRAMTA